MIGACSSFRDDRGATDTADTRTETASAAPGRAVDSTAIPFDSVVMTAAGPVLRLSPLARAALDSGAPGFVPNRAQDYPDFVLRYFGEQGGRASLAVAGDFNGDGRPDVALEGFVGKERATFALFRNESGYTAIPVARGRIAERDTVDAPGRTTAYLTVSPPNTRTRHNDCRYWLWILR